MNTPHLTAGYVEAEAEIRCAEQAFELALLCADIAAAASAAFSLWDAGGYYGELDSYARHVCSSGLRQAHEDVIPSLDLAYDRLRAALAARDSLSNPASETPAEPQPGAHADLVEVLTCQTKLTVWNPEPVPSGQPAPFGRITGSSGSLDLLCGGSHDGLLTRREGDAPKLVLPARSFSLARYNLADPAGRAAGKEYVRRKLQPFTPI